MGTQGSSDIMAQAVFLAQLEAAKGGCKCNTCRILRRASTMMTAQFLQAGGSETPGDPGIPASSEVLTLGKEDE